MNNKIKTVEIQSESTLSDIIFNKTGLFELDLEGQRLIVKKISDADGFCGFRSVADAACKVSDQSDFEAIVNNLRFEMIAQDLKKKINKNAKKAFIKEKLIKKNVSDRWADTELFVALTESENFKFKIQLISFGDQDQPNLIQVLLIENGYISVFRGLDKLNLDADTITLINASDVHFDRVLYIQKVPINMDERFAYYCSLNSRKASTSTQQPADDRKKPESKFPVIFFRAFSICDF